MNILFVAPRIPYPLDTGAKIRTYNLLKSVSGSHNVSLLSFDFDGDAHAQENLKKLGIKIIPVKAKEGMRLFSIFSDTPVVIDKYYSRQMADAIQNIASNNKFDLAHFDHLHMGQYRRYLDGIPCVLDEHNVESMMTERCAKMERNVVRKALFGLQAGKMAKFESVLIRQFSRCLAVSKDDKDALMRMSDGKARVEVVPNGVDTEYFSSQLITPNSKLPTHTEDALVFTGSMDWLPNEDAVLYFANDILPIIWKDNSNVKFYIVGRNPNKKVQSLGRRDSRIIVTGVVDDVRTYISRSKVFVAPLRMGGGTRLKILEAMSMEKAVVSTRLGAEGIEYREDVNPVRDTANISNGVNIVLADDPTEFADKVISLLDNENRARDIGLEGRKLVLEKYDWNVIGEKLHKIYREALSAKNLS